MTTDDTFIFLQFVSNMLSGHGMSFNAGEPTYGFTSVLWVALLYLTGLVSNELLLNAKVASFVFALLSIVAFHLLAKRFLRSPLHAHAATVAWALNPIFVNMAFSGMESTLGTFLLIGGLLQHFGERESKRHYPLAPAIFAIAYLTRPEFLLLFPLWLADTWLNSDSAIRPKRLITGVVTYAVPIGIWLLIAQLQFDTVIPNPVVIKALQSKVDYQTYYVAKRLVLMLGSIHAADLAVLLSSFAVMFAYRGSGERRFHSLFAKPDTFLWLWVTGVLGTYLVQNVAVSPRYFLIVSPVLTLLAFRQIALLGETSFPWKTKWLVCALILFALQSIIATTFIYYPHTSAYTEKDKLLKQAALWLRQNTTEDIAVASVDIGVLGYYSKRRVVDQTGLINPDIIRRESALGYLHGKGVQYLLDRNPKQDYLTKSSKDGDWLQYEPVLFLSTPRTGWTAGLTETDRIGFTLYRLSWKQR